MEETPHYFFAFALIGEFLFAQHPNEVYSAPPPSHPHSLTPSHPPTLTPLHPPSLPPSLPHTLTPSQPDCPQFSSYLDQLPYFEQLLTEPESFWVAMVAKYFVQAPRVSVSAAGVGPAPSLVATPPTPSGGGCAQPGAVCAHAGGGGGAGGAAVGGAGGGGEEGEGGRTGHSCEGERGGCSSLSS